MRGYKKNTVVIIDTVRRGTGKRNYTGATREVVFELS